MTNLSDWKEFNVGKLLNPKTTKLSIKSELDKGNIPFISRTGLNNGVDDYIDVESYKVTHGDCITIGAEGLFAFYQANDFATGNKVYALRNSDMNKRSALFICTILNLEVFKYSYGRARVLNKLQEEIIKLPAKLDENNNFVIDGNKIYSDEGFIPDWDYMEKFIEKLETRERENQGSIRDALRTDNKAEKVADLNINDWKEFVLEDIFEEIYKSEAYVKSDLTTFDSNALDRISFISRTDKNNGCDCYVPLDDISVKEKGNAIIIGDTTSTIYYQENDFITGDHIVVCRAKWINKYTALFIKSLIEKERYKYSYGRAFKMDLIKKTKINLPAININGEFVPDWDFMQNYINSLPYGDKI